MGSQLNRIVNTHHHKIDLSRPYNQSPLSLKPKGVWYGIDDSWLQWMHSNEPGWIKPVLIELQINISGLLIIKSPTELASFIEEYADPDFIKPFSYRSIQWNKVADRYKGIEIQNYPSLRWKSYQLAMDCIWLSAWDASSGCIWDLSCIKSFKHHRLADHEYRIYAS